MTDDRRIKGNFSPKNADPEKVWGLLVAASADPASFENRGASGLKALKIEASPSHLLSDDQTPTPLMIAYAIKHFIVWSWPKGSQTRGLPRVTEFDATVCRLTRDQYANRHPGEELSDHIVKSHLQVSQKLEKKPWEAFGKDQGESLKWGLAQALTQWFAKLRDDGHTPQISVDELFLNRELAGPSAMASLKAQLVTRATEPGPAYAAPPALKDHFEFDDRGWLGLNGFDAESFPVGAPNEDDARLRCLSDLRTAIFAERSTLQLINACSGVMRAGMSGLAAELFDQTARRTHRSPWPILYLPLHGRTIDNPEDSYPELVYQIWYFYRDMHERLMARAEDAGENTESHIEEISDSPLDQYFEKPESLNQTVEIIRATRRLMAIYPAILVFDGYRVCHSSDAEGASTKIDGGHELADLLRGIEDDDLLTLIERLAEPPTPDTTSEPIDLALFRRNKFVVLSDRPLYLESPKLLKPGRPLPDQHRGLNSIPGASIEIVQPDDGHFPHLLRSYRLRDPGWIQSIYTQFGFEGPPIEHLHSEFASHLAELEKVQSRPPFHAVNDECTFGVVSTIGTLGCWEHTHISEPNPLARDVVHSLIENDLVGLIKAYDPRWLVYLDFISLAPGGLRPKTLCRLYEAYESILAGRGYPSLQSPSPDRDVINASIVEMLDKLSGILGAYRSDTLEALKRKRLATPITRRAVSHELAADRVIQFAFPDIRQYFLEAASRPLEDGPGPSSRRMLLHFLLAEEAHEQNLLLQLYDERQMEPSLRRRRRLLGCLYHGAASLGNDKLNIDLPEGTCGRFLPADPKERFIALYELVFRRQLDQAEHHLTRSFAADHVKRQILLMLRSPQICYGALPSSAEPALGEANREVIEKFTDDLYASANYAGVSFDRSEVAALTSRLRPESAKLGAVKRMIDVAAIPLKSTHVNLGKHYLKQRDSIVMPFLDEIFGTGRITTCLQLIDAEVGKLLQPAASPSAQLSLDGFVEALVSKANPRGQLDFGFDIPNADRRANDQNLTHAVDLLNRYADYTAIKADADDVQQTPTSATLGENEPSVRDGLVRAFSAYSLADRLRARMYKNSPSRARDLLSGHATRTHIRVALKLIAFHAENKLGGRDTWFYWRAQELAIELTQHLSRFPRERAGILIIESTMARRYGSETAEQARGLLEESLECLRCAEPLVLRLGMHSRLRFRFALERSKVLVEIVKLYAVAGGVKQKAIGRRFLALAEADAFTLQKLGESDTLWRYLARRHIDAIERVKASLSSGDGHPDTQV